ncbi:MAG: hypothetical protein ACOCX2_14110 [Armatimonadota bacterium]
MTLRRLLAICFAAALVVLMGCQTTTPTGSPLVSSTQDGQAAQGHDPDAMGPEQQQLLNKLEAKLDELDRQGMTLEDALQRMHDQERAEAGPPALVKDIWPAQRVLNDAIEAARSSKQDETVEALDRLVTLTAAVTGDLPATQIMVHCERALAFLSQNALDEAAIEMSLAHRVADGTRFATLVPPNVISLIQTSARSQIQAGRAREAADVVLTVLNACAEHQSLDRMTRIDRAITGAREAVEREAWPVVEAELFEAHRELTDLSETIRPERWELTGEDADEPVAGADETTDEGAEAEGPAGEAAEEGTDAPGTGGADEGVATDEAVGTEAGSGRARPRGGRR